MIPWEMRHRNPMIDLKMVGTRQFGAAFVVMLATGAILLATTQFLPQLVQQNFGYTATWAGLLLSPGGLVTMVMMFVVGRLAAKVQPKYLIIVGAVLIAASMYQMTNVYGDLGFWYMARSRMLLGVGLPLIFIPIMTASYDGIAQSKTDQASALINAARNTGGSIGVSIVSNVLTHREQFHQSRLVESVLPSSVQLSGHASPPDGLFRGAGQLAAPGAAAGDPMDRTTGADPGVVPRLHGRLLGADAHLARHGSARADPAQDQARWFCLHGPLIRKGDTAVNVQVR
jgi:DHA2 family multidrug resistance protein